MPSESIRGKIKEGEDWPRPELKVAEEIRGTTHNIVFSYSTTLLVLFTIIPLFIPFSFMK